MSRNLQISSGKIQNHLWRGFELHQENLLVPLPQIYLAVDFDGVLHHALVGPSRETCIEYGQKRISGREFIHETNRSAKDLGADEEWQLGELFDRADLLADEISRSKASVGIVIATSWRNRMSEARIRDLLPLRLQTLVCGVLGRHDNEQNAPGVRGELMQQWVRDNAPDSPWWALDDVPSLWKDHIPQLIQTPSEGLETRSLARLSAILSGLGARVVCVLPAAASGSAADSTS